MMRCVIVFLIQSFWLPQSASIASNTPITFCGQKLVLKYDSEVTIRKYRSTAKSFEKYMAASAGLCSTLFDSASRWRMKHRLNDLLYYKLLDTISRVVENSPVDEEYLKFLLLGRSGYRVNLAFDRKVVLALVQSNEKGVVDVLRAGNYYCLDYSAGMSGKVRTLRNNPFKKNTRLFSFSYDPIPEFLEGTAVNKAFQIPNESGLPDSLVVTFNTSLLEALKANEQYSFLETFSAPISPSVSILIDTIARRVSNLSDREKINYILSFVVRNSIYLSDRATSRKEDEWLTPEEFLFYGRGDCEDHSAFLFYALKHLVKRPLLIVDYPKIQHVNIAVSLTDEASPDFMYKGRPYSICEPTTEKVIEVGQYKLNNEPYEIIGEWTPDK